MFIIYDDCAPEIWWSKEYRYWKAEEHFVTHHIYKENDPHNGPSDCVWMIPSTVQ